MSVGSVEIQQYEPTRGALGGVANDEEQVSGRVMKVMKVDTFSEKWRTNRARSVEGALYDERVVVLFSRMFDSVSNFPAIPFFSSLSFIVAASASAWYGGVPIIPASIVRCLSFLI